MIIKDKIYGEIKIKDLVLIEFLESPSLLRLKKMSNYGIPDKYYHHKGYSRYEHSVGVMILLKKFGASLEEQIAGLVHDVSHLAFSHVADWIFSGGENGDKEELADNLLEKIIRTTELAKILEKFNLSIERIINKKNDFPLLEKNIPNLCADRIDYVLRELKYTWGVKQEVLNTYLKYLVNFNGEIVFLDEKVAFDFAKDFIELQTKHWGSREAMVRYYLFAKVMKIALSKRILLKKYFFKEEDFVLRKIEKINDKEIKNILALLRKKKISQKSSGSFKKVFKKFRYVDPKVLVNVDLLKLSEINHKFEKMIKKHQEINKKGIII